MTEVQIQTCLHASLAANVAAWDAYIHNLVSNFFAEISDPLLASFSAVHRIAQTAADIALGRFKTPNWDNTRNILAQYTGYDPYGDWLWPARHMNVAQVQERLDQILKVRHSFAHGFPLPAYPWTVSPSGHIRLTGAGVSSTHAFFGNLVRRTDKGMVRHISAAFGKNPGW